MIVRISDNVGSSGSTSEQTVLDIKMQIAYMEINSKCLQFKFFELDVDIILVPCTPA